MKRWPLWKTRSDSTVKSVFPYNSTTCHSSSSQKVILKRSRSTILSTDKVVSAKVVMLMVVESVRH